jgi:hypothetical protein
LSFAALVFVVFVTLVVFGMMALGMLIAISRVSPNAGLTTHHGQLVEFGLLPAKSGDATGTLAGKPAWVGEVASSTHGSVFKLRVEQLPVDLALRNRGSAAKQVRSGDARLDKAWTIGSRDGGVGRLHKTVRDGLVYLDRYVESVVLHDGTLELTCTTPSHLLHALSIVRTLIPILLGDATTLLADRAQNDVDPKVRAQMLWELAQHDRDRARVVAASRDAAEDWGVEELLLMGELLEDRHCLMRAMTHKDGTAAIGVRAATASLRLGADPGPIIRAVAGAQGMTAILKLASYIATSDGEGLDALTPYVAAVLDRTKTRDPDLRERTLLALCEALEAHPSESSRSALLLVARKGPGAPQRRAVGALARIGGVEEVGPLRSIQAGLAVTEFATSGAIDTAIAQIQSKASGDAGALSLAVLPADVGALSEAVPVPARPRMVTE